MNERPPDAPPGSRFQDEAGAAITHVRGSTVAVFASMLAGEFGEAAWPALVATLSEGSRQALDHDIGAYTWVPVAAVIELESRLPPGSRTADGAHRGATTADQHMTVAHKWLLGFLSVETILRQSSLLFRFYYKGGRAWLEDFAKGEGRLAIQAEGMYAGWYTETLPAYLVRLIELSGACEVRARHEPAQAGMREPVHHYHLAWRD